MDHTHVIGWLTRKRRIDAAQNSLVGLLLCLAGAAVLVVTWALAYCICLFCLSGYLGFHHWSYTLIPTLLLPLLFWGNSRTDAEYLSEYSVTTGTASDQVVVFYLPRIGVVSNVNPLAPDTFHTMVKIVTDALYFGPRLVMMGCRMIRKAVRLGRLDVSRCATVIKLLNDMGHRLSFQEIVNAVPGLNPVAVFPQLRDIDGVLFLESEPPGLSLSSDWPKTHVF